MSVKNYALGAFNLCEINYCKKWQAVQAALDMFWIRQLREYLPSLTDRKKCTTNSRNLEIGTQPLQSQKILFVLHGQLVVSFETCPGVDGVVRSVKVKTPNNKFVRPTASFCLLEVVSQFQYHTSLPKEESVVI